MDASSRVILNSASCEARCIAHALSLFLLATTGWSRRPESRNSEHCSRGLSRLAHCSARNPMTRVFRMTLQNVRRQADIYLSTQMVNQVEVLRATMTVLTRRRCWLFSVYR